MAITFAGEVLLHPEDEGGLDVWLDRFLPLEDLRAIVWPSAASYGLHDDAPIPNYPDPPRARINQLYLPSGAARWSTFYGLATGSVVERLITGNEGRGDGSAFTGNQLILASGTESAAEAFSILMHMLPPRPVSGRDVGGEGLWLLPLVDERYFWQFESVASPTTTSWLMLLSSLVSAGASNTSITSANAAENDNATLLADLGTPSPRVFGGYGNVAIYLDALAHSTGRRVVWRPDDTDVWNLRYPDESLTDLQNRINRARGLGPATYFGLDAGETQSLGDDFGDATTPENLPTSIVVVFPKVADGTRTGEYHAETITAATLGLTLPGSSSRKRSQTFRAEFPADFTLGGGTPDNATAVTDYATAIATFYYRGRARGYDVTYPGILPNGNLVDPDRLRSGPVMDYYTDAITLTITPDNCTTRIQSVPNNFEAARLAAGDSSLDTDATTEIVEVCIDAAIAYGASGVFSTSGAATVKDALAATTVAVDDQITVYAKKSFTGFLLPGMRAFAAKQPDGTQWLLIEGGAISATGTTAAAVADGANGTFSLTDPTAGTPCNGSPISSPVQVVARAVGYIDASTSTLLTWRKKRAGDSQSYDFFAISRNANGDQDPGVSGSGGGGGCDVCLTLPNPDGSCPEGSTKVWITTTAPDGCSDCGSDAASASGSGNDCKFICVEDSGIGECPSEGSSSAAGTVATDCCGNEISSTLTVTFDGSTGSGWLGHTLAITYDSGLGYWVGSKTISGCTNADFTVEVRVRCFDPGGGPEWQYYIDLSGGDCTEWTAGWTTAASSQCDPFELTDNETTAAACCDLLEDGLDFTITE